MIDLLQFALMKNDLEKARRKIDAIDDELIKLFLERLSVSREVALAKKEAKGAVVDPMREREILTKISEAAGAENENAARMFFTNIFSISKARQRSILKGPSPLLAEIDLSFAQTEPFPSRAFVACCGAEGSYAQQAVSQMVKVPTIVYFSEFEKVFEAVEKGFCPYGVLPVENSAAGSVAAVYDLMLKHRFHIAKAIKLKVDHALLAPQGVKMSDIREVISHPHAFSQCRQFLKEHSSLKVTPAVNTAVAAKELSVSSRRDVAVIASRACAELYGLDVLADRVQDAAYNYTRFICISKDLEIRPDANMMSVMMSLPHRPGALSAIISKFAAIDVNLTKLESRPVPGMDFEFSFVFDFDSSVSNPSVRELLAELSQDPEIEHFEFLGSYNEK